MIASSRKAIRSAGESSLISAIYASCSLQAYFTSHFKALGLKLGYSLLADVRLPMPVLDWRREQEGCSFWFKLSFVPSPSLDYRTECQARKGSHNTNVSHDRRCRWEPRGPSSPSYSDLPPCAKLIPSTQRVSRFHAR
jgi:hypothetical protein